MGVQTLQESVTVTGRSAGRRDDEDRSWRRRQRRNRFPFFPVQDRSVVNLTLPSCPRPARTPRA